MHTSYYPIYSNPLAQYTSIMPQFTNTGTSIKSEINSNYLVKEKTEVEEEKPFSVYVRPEIRKGCVWEVQFRFSDTFLSEVPLTKFYGKVASLDLQENNLKSGEYYVLLKIRSKLIEPRKEVPFDKVAEYVGDLPLKFSVESNAALMRVKFTARPRNIFHKHADVMILVASLYRGETLLSEDQQELIFRGGTGSAHSAENRKQQVLKNNATNVTVPGYSPMGTLYPMMYPYNMPSMTSTTNILPQMQQTAPRTPAPTTNTNSDIVRAEALTVPELEDFDSDTFFSDFMNNKGDSLNLYDGLNNQSSYTNSYSQSTTNTTSSTTTTGYPDAPAFSFNITGFQLQQNGVFQGTIEGTYLNKPFRGQFQTSMDDSNIQGSFSGSFN